MNYAQQAALQLGILYKLEKRKPGQAIEIVLTEEEYGTFSVFELEGWNTNNHEFWPPLAYLRYEETDPNWLKARPAKIVQRKANIKKELERMYPENRELLTRTEALINNVHRTDAGEYILLEPVNITPYDPAAAEETDSDASSVSLHEGDADMAADVASVISAPKSHKKATGTDPFDPSLLGTPSTPSAGLKFVAETPARLVEFDGFNLVTDDGILGAVLEGPGLFDMNASPTQRLSDPRNDLGFGELGDDDMPVDGFDTPDFKG